MREEAAAIIEQSLGYAFSNRSLLETALTHTSFVKGDGKGALHNERMEFLGDAVLELIVSEHLYKAHPEVQEGALTRMRARLVCEDALFSAARALGLPGFLLLGHGEEQSGGRSKPSVVSDAMEAVIGAVFLDGGMEAAKTLVLGRVVELLEAARVEREDKDYKTRLQERTQRDHLGQPAYLLLSEDGPEHKKTFTMRVTLGDRTLGTGSGCTKQAAGQAAAKNALTALAAGEDRP